MNETLKTLLERRSVRAFSHRNIEKSQLELIVQAGRYAPSAMNRQLLQFTVVSNGELIKKLAGEIAAELDRGSDYDFYCPAAIILVSSPEDNPHRIEDCACALTNIFNAAYSLGVGSVWINQLKGICNVPKVRAVLDELKLPQNHCVYGMAALGYPKNPINQAVAKTEKVVWIE